MEIFIFIYALLISPLNHERLMVTKPSILTKQELGKSIEQATNRQRAIATTYMQSDTFMLR